MPDPHLPYRLREAIRQGRQAERLAALDELAELIRSVPAASRLVAEVQSLLRPYLSDRDLPFRQQVIALLDEIERRVKLERLDGQIDRLDSRRRPASEFGAQMEGMIADRAYDDLPLVEGKAQCPACGSVYFDRIEDHYRCRYCHTSYRIAGSSPALPPAPPKATRAISVSHPFTSAPPRLDAGRIKQIVFVLFFGLLLVRCAFDELSTGSPIQPPAQPQPTRTQQTTQQVVQGVEPASYEVLKAGNADSLAAYFDLLRDHAPVSPYNVYFTPGEAYGPLTNREIDNFALSFRIEPVIEMREDRAWSVGVEFRIEPDEGYQEIALTQDVQQVSVSAAYQLESGAAALLEPQLLPYSTIERYRSTPVQMLVFGDQALLCVDDRHCYRFALQPGTGSRVMIYATFVDPPVGSFGLSINQIEFWLLPEEGDQMPPTPRPGS